MMLSHARTAVVSGIAGIVLAGVIALPRVDDSPAGPVRTVAEGTVVPREGCRRAPRPEGGTWTRFGTSLSTTSLTFAQALDAQQRKYGRLRAVRVFDPGVPPSNAWENRAPVLGRRLVLTSFRMPPAEVLTGRYDAALLHFFRTAPRKGKVLWSYLHEPEPHILAGTFTAREYRRAFRRIVELATHACRKNLLPTLVLTGWTSMPESGRDWRDYYPGPRYVSVLAWDPYNSASRVPTSYVAPRDLFGPLVRIARETGKPFGIAETGSVLVAGDDGAGRAEWLTRVGRYLTRKQALFVTYFDSTRDGHYRLDDAPSIAAWRAWVQS